MNLLDAQVLEVYSKPVKMYNKWWVTVKYDCWGRSSVTRLMFETKEEAEKVTPGFKFVT